MLTFLLLLMIIVMLDVIFVFEKSFNCKLLSYDEYFSEDYRQYLEDKFILYENNKEIEWFNNKYFAVLKKES